jgi:hypothetical protein
MLFIKKLWPVYLILLTMFTPLSIYCFVVNLRIEKFNRYIERQNAALAKFSKEIE